MNDSILAKTGDAIKPIRGAIIAMLPSSESKISGVATTPLLGPDIDTKFIKDECDEKFVPKPGTLEFAEEGTYVHVYFESHRETIHLDWIRKYLKTSPFCRLLKKKMDDLHKTPTPSESQIPVLKGDKASNRIVCEILGNDGKLPANSVFNIHRNCTDNVNRLERLHSSLDAWGLKELRDTLDQYIEYRREIELLIKQLIKRTGIFDILDKIHKQCLQMYDAVTLEMFPPDGAGPYEEMREVYNYVTSLLKGFPEMILARNSVRFRPRTMGDKVSKEPMTIEELMNSPGGMDFVVETLLTYAIQLLSFNCDTTKLRPLCEHEMKCLDTIKEALDKINKHADNPVFFAKIMEIAPTPIRMLISFSGGGGGTTVGIAGDAEKSEMIMSEPLGRGGEPDLRDDGSDSDNDDGDEGVHGVSPEGDEPLSSLTRSIVNDR